MTIKRTLFRALLPALVVLLQTASDSSAQAITGRVVDSGGRPLVSANILLHSIPLEQARYGTATNRDGVFKIDVAPGRYRITTTYLGYDRDTRDVNVTGADRLDVLIELAPRTVAHPEVVIAARRAQPQYTPVTFSNVTAEDLRARPEMKDLPVVLSTRPSTTYYSENGNGIGYSTLRIRGFDQRRLAVSINGIPQNDPEDFNVFWVNFFDVDGVVEDIQVQRGAGASLYGSTGIGGAINIVARPYRPYPYAEFSGAYGSFDTRKLSVEANSGLLHDRYVIFGRYSRLQSDGYRRWSWSEFDRFFVGVTRYGRNSTVTLQAYGGPQQDGLAFSGIPRSANTEIVDGPLGTPIDRRFNASEASRDKESFHQPHAEIHHEWTPSRNVKISQSLFWVAGKGYFDFGANFRSAEYLMLPPGFVSDDLRTLPLFLSRPDANVIFRANLDQWQVGWMPRITLASRLGETIAGAEVRLHRSERWGRIQDATGLPPDLVGSDADRRVYQFRGEKTIASAAISHTARPTAGIAVQAELYMTHARYRTYDDSFFGIHFAKPYLFVNPRLGVTVNPGGTWSGFGSIGYSSREPRLKSLYDGEEAGAGFRPRFELDSAGEPDTDHPLVKPEHLLDFELGVTRSDDRSLVALNAFWMEFTDEIVPSGGLDQFGVARTGNADRTRHIGAEVEWRVGLTRRLGLYGNFTVARATYSKFTEFVFLPDLSTAAADRSGNPIPGFPSTNGNLELNYRKSGLRAALFGRYVGRQYIDSSEARDLVGRDDNSLTVDPYFLVDASLGYTFRAGSPFEGLTVSVDLNNLLDERVLLFGNVGPLGPQFFPTATRHLLFRASLVIR